MRSVRYSVEAGVEKHRGWYAASTRVSRHVALRKAPARSPANCRRSPDSAWYPPCGRGVPAHAAHAVDGRTCVFCCVASRRETNGPQRPTVGLFGQGRAGQLQAAVQAAGRFGVVGGAGRPANLQGSPRLSVGVPAHTGKARSGPCKRRILQSSRSPSRTRLLLGAAVLAGVWLGPRLQPRA